MTIMRRGAWTAEAMASSRWLGGGIGRDVTERLSVLAGVGLDRPTGGIEGRIGAAFRF